MFCCSVRTAVRLFVGVLFASSVAAVPALGQDVPFMGVVTQDSTNARAGAGRAYYVVGEVPAGTLVQVDEVIFGWNKVVPPEGFHSYVSRAHVDARGDGRIGAVNADRVEVRAASTRGFGESYRVQTVLNRGDTVQIVERDGEAYKIVPPKDAYIFLPPGSVNRATPEQIAAAREQGAEEADASAPAQPPAPQAPAPTPEPTPAPVAEQPVEPSADVQAQPDADAEQRDVAAAVEPENDRSTAQQPQPAATAPSPREPVAQTSPDQASPDQTPPAEDAPAVAINGEPAPREAAPPMRSPAVSGKMRALEDRMLPLMARPLEQQPFDRMIREYEAMRREQLPAADRQLLAARLAVLHRNRDLAATLAQIQRAKADSVEMDLPTIDPDAPQRYDAVGRLLASSVYDGVSLPRMFRVVDLVSGRTIIWVEPGGMVEPRQYLGKVVGVSGSQQYDPALKFNVLSVQRIDALEPAAPVQ